MNNAFSLILDFSRFLAALLVFIYHAEQIQHDGRLSLLASFGHDAVIFFFLLSGFVIGFVSTHKEKSLEDYSIARMARIYSVALPSLILSFVLYQLGQKISPSVYSDFSGSNWMMTFLSSVLFVNQAHWSSIGVPTNAPYWSVCYEAWFYVIFGVGFYMKGYKKYVFCTAALFLAGLKIVLLMPIWLLGLLCFIFHQKLALGKPVGYLLIAVTLPCYLAMRYLNVDDMLFLHSANLLGGEEAANTILGWSKRFAPDYVIALLFTLLFAGIYVVRDDLERMVVHGKKWIKFLASYTFSLYLYHFPILLFLSTVIDSTALVMSLCLLLIALVGHVTERKKSLLAALFRRGLASVRRTL